MSDAAYEVDTQRVRGGVVPGIAEPDMHNKLFRQATVMVAALAQVIADAGFDAMDNDYSGLVANLRKAFVGTVNGVKPDSKGNVDLTQVITAEIRRFAVPEVGQVIITTKSTDPSTRSRNALKL